MSTERPVFITHALCPLHLRKQVEDVAESFNPDWLLPPMNGEVFDSFQECFARLQGYAFSQGFAVVTLSSGKKKARAQFGCIHQELEEAREACYLIRSRSLNGQSPLKPMARPLHGR